MSNVIRIDMRPEFLDVVKKLIVDVGPVRAKEFLIAEGEHPSFVYAVVKRIIRGYHRWD
jgi:hypothetical protein